MIGRPSFPRPESQPKLARGEFLQENGQHDEYGYTDRDVVVMWLVRKEQSDAQS